MILIVAFLPRSRLIFSFFCYTNVLDPLFVSDRPFFLLSFLICFAFYLFNCSLPLPLVSFSRLLLCFFFFLYVSVSASIGRGSFSAFSSRR